MAVTAGRTSSQMLLNKWLKLGIKKRRTITQDHWKGKKAKSGDDVLIWWCRKRRTDKKNMCFNFHRERLPKQKRMTGADRQHLSGSEEGASILFGKYRIIYGKGEGNALVRRGESYHTGGGGGEGTQDDLGQCVDFVDDRGGAKELTPIQEKEET